MLSLPAAVGGSGRQWAAVGGRGRKAGRSEPVSLRWRGVGSNPSRRPQGVRLCRLAIVTWIEVKYHRKRRKERIGKMTPIEFEALDEALNRTLTAA